MGEVYWGCFECAPERRGCTRAATAAGAEAVAASRAGHASQRLGWMRAVCGAGSGFDAYRGACGAPR